MMGSPDGEGAVSEHPRHKVTLDSFYIDIYTVTQGDYEKVMGVNPAVYKGDLKRPIENDTWYDALLYCNARSKRDGLEQVYRFSGIEGVPGDGCQGLKDLFIDYSKIGYRLPTEAEWEYACRAGTTSKYYWGEKVDGDYAWSEINTGATTNPVDVKKPNAWGLHDMCGNVQEWCNDWFGETYFASSPEKNPHGPETGIHRILRGGSWYPYKNGGLHLRCANRSCNLPDYRRDAYGFRCVVPC
jgi:formylglycine-generating enzyme required for sulfatase activity